MIELPAEANPLTERMLYKVLQSAASNEPLQIQSGSKQLQKWEIEKGYYPLLQSLFIDKSLPLEVRYLAIIQLKNGIDKYWRKTATHAISEHDRSIIRSRLIESGVQEADRKLALQNALLVAKIIRYEFPRDWPGAISTVVTQLRSSSVPGANHLHLPRSLLILLYIVKELSTGRLQRTKASFQSVTPEILAVLGRVYLEKVHKWRSFVQFGGDDEGGAIEEIELSHLCLKILRRLMIAGYEFPNRDNDVLELWTLLRRQWLEFWDMTGNIQYRLAPCIVRLLEKHILQLGKLHLEMAKVHPAAFIVLPQSLPLVRDYWGIVRRYGETLAMGEDSRVDTAEGIDFETEETTFKELITLKGLQLIRAVLQIVFHPTQTFRYRHPQEKEERAQSTARVRQELLTEDLIRELVDKLMSLFFVLRGADLEEWEHCQEEWESKVGNESEDFEYSIRPCSERLFLDLIINYKSLLVQPLLSTIYSTATLEYPDITMKDSVYTAVGLAAPVLHPHLDFDRILTSTLVVEVQNRHPQYKILRRRIAILLSQWISVGISESNQSVVYQIFRHLLDNSDPLNDLVIRTSAGKRLKAIVADWEFRVEQFLPIAPDILSQIMLLVEEVTMTETKMALLDTIGVVIERLEHHIIPYADAIVSLLRPLWEQCGEEHLMKQAILTMLSCLINSMKTESRKFHPLVLSIIRGVFEPGSESQVYLLEDALELWCSIISQTAASEYEGVSSLAPYLFIIFDLGSDHVRKALEITESYLLLTPSTMLGPELRPRLLCCFANLLPQLKRETASQLTQLIGILVRAADGIGGEAAVQVVATDMVSSGFLRIMLTDLRVAWEAHQSTWPNRVQSSMDGLLESDYLAALARLMFASPQIFVGAVQAIANAAGWCNDRKVELASYRPNEDAAIGWLLEEWFLHLENVGDPARRKLMCLGLTKLLSTGDRRILRKAQDLMTMWTDVVNELTEGMEDKAVDSLIYWDTDNIKPSQFDTPADERRRNLTFSDPVHTVNVVHFIREQLQECIRICGGEEHFQQEWLINVDRDVIQAFGQLGIL